MALSTQSLIGYTGQDLMFRFSEIAGILKGRLTSAELNDLLAELLSKSAVEVHSGDLITAEWAMGIMRRLERLELVGVQTLPINNKVLTCLQDTTTAYDGLLTQGVFIPSEGSVSVKAILQMTAALQRIIVFSLAGMSVAVMADESTLVDVFQRLYDAQKDLVALLSSSLLGTVAFDQRNLFAKLLKFQLDEDQRNGVMSLRTALNQKDLNAAITAQNRINGISMEQSGDVTLGNLQVIYQGSNDGESLKVPDTVSYTFNFRVYNKTNRKVNVQVSASFRNHQAWKDCVDISGAKLLRDLIPFDITNPSDPKAYRDVEVVVKKTPDEAKIGEEYFLDMNAEIPAPISLGKSDFVKLRGDTERRPPTVNWVRFEKPPYLIAGGTLILENKKRLEVKATQYETISVKFSYKFHATTGQTTRKFLVTIQPDLDIVTIDSSNPEGKKFFIEITGFSLVLDDKTNSIPKLVSESFDVVSDREESFQIDVTPLKNSAGNTLTYSVSINSVDDTLKPEPDSTQSVSIKAI